VGETPADAIGFRVSQRTTTTTTTTEKKEGEQVLLLCVHCRVTGYVRVPKFVPPVCTEAAAADAETSISTRLENSELSRTLCYSLSLFVVAS
jgi:hypothetical protein